MDLIWLLKVMLMKWIEPKYSRERVRKAGKHIRELNIESKEFKEAIPVFQNWR